jgi:hypothetical protein
MTARTSISRTTTTTCDGATLFRVVILNNVVYMTSQEMAELELALADFRVINKNIQDG